MVGRRDSMVCVTYVRQSDRVGAAPAPTAESRRFSVPPLPSAASQATTHEGQAMCHTNTCNNNDNNNNDDDDDDDDDNTNNKVQHCTAQHVHRLPLP